jgi:ribosomal-protein-alanine N-acetyltransferase
VRYRPATADDLEAILALIDRAGVEGPSLERDRVRLTDWLVDGGQHNEVAEGDRGVVGYVNLRVHDGEAHVTYLFVDPGDQGRGIGARLLDRAVADARRRGHRRVRLTAGVENVRARRFYEREGWRDTGERHRHSALGVEMAHYALELEAP